MRQVAFKPFTGMVKLRKSFAQSKLTAGLPLIALATNMGWFAADDCDAFLCRGPGCRG
jgi:hypothetical protein